MITRAYTIFDVKAMAYSPPFFQLTDGLAQRLLQDLVHDQTTSMARHPSDFVLYFVGTFDDQSGILAPVQPIQHVVDAAQLVSTEGSMQNFHPMMRDQPRKETNGG